MFWVDAFAPPLERERCVYVFVEAFTELSDVGLLF